MSEKSGQVAVITGASSGIGRACALLLVREGFQVFAGVRRPEDGDKLVIEAGNRLMPLIIDVTDIESIAAAVKEVTAKLQERGLDGLVNVAGIGITGPLEYVTAADLSRVFQVNVFGQIAVTQAFLPLIRNARGRIVNMSSIGAHIALPFGGVLTASKGALGLLSDALRMELRPFGIRVCVIEPASIKTPAVEKTLGDVDGVIRCLPPEGARCYGDMLRAFTKRAYATEMNGSAPDVVARAVHQALTARRPRIRYTVGKGAKLLATLPRLLPDRLLDSIRMRILGLSAFIAELVATRIWERDAHGERDACAKSKLTRSPLFPSNSMTKTAGRSSLFISPASWLKQITPISSLNSSNSSGNTENFACYST